jgi:predicted dehydrogenase
MTYPINRRRFLNGTAVSVAGFAVFGPHIVSAAEKKLNIAGIGIGGKGHSDIHSVSQGQNVVALCDVDRSVLDRVSREFPQAKLYTDYREVLGDKSVDAVTISTPDHMHAPIAVAAMYAGKHVYCQKPLTHSVFEARRMAEIARETGVVTQIGTQHHATSRFKTAVHAVRTGKLGQVTEVHIWTDRPIWPQGMDRPSGSDPIPTGLDWDKWLGVAPGRPFKSDTYHPFKWRGFWDFGTGALGDMGCHFIDPAFTALDLRTLRTVEAQGPSPHPDTAPAWTIVRYEFDHVLLTWYDGKRLPPCERIGWQQDERLPDNGIIFVGDRATLFINHEAGPTVVSSRQKSDIGLEPVAESNHYLEWTSACLGEGTTTCPFSHAGPLTELVLLGNVAYRSGTKITWDSARMTTNSQVADSFLKREYRSGWEVAGL